jgi:hypothetical protein
MGILKSQLQLKNNYIPVGIIPLKQLFDQKDVVIKKILKTFVKDIEEVNLGTLQKPKMIRLSKMFVE